jgi:lysozyme
MNAEDFIRQWEGCELTAYNDIGGRLSVGIGHLVTDDDDITLGDTITQQEADDFFNDDFSYAADSVKDLVHVTLNDNQLIALVSLVFNIGVGAFSSSTLLKILNAGDFAGAAQEFLKWDHCNGVVSQGLLNRRKAEMALFEESV